jgi:vitamin K-dependent gamma-carboxylase-like protein
VTGVRERFATAYGAWEQWWFGPRETSTLAIIRIYYGVLMIFWTLSQIPTVDAFLGPHGIVPKAPDYSKLPGGWASWSVLSLFPSEGAAVALLVVMLVASVSVAIGFRARVGAALLFIGSVSLQRRDPYVYNAGDILIRIMALYMMLSPCGEALSLDRWRRYRDRFWEFPLKSQWALRLMQLQVSFVYLDSVWAKVRGQHWNDGTAVSIALRIGDLNRLPVPHFMTSSEIVANLLTYGALATEFALGTLVWNRKARPYVLLAGVGLHLGIDWAIRVGFFSYAVIMFYGAFIEPSALSARLLALRARLTGRTRQGAVAETP